MDWENETPPRNSEEMSNDRSNRRRNIRVSTPERPDLQVRSRVVYPSTDRRLERLESLIEKLINQDSSASSNAEGPTRERSAREKPTVPIRLNYAATSDCIPEFEPGNPNLTSVRWLQKVEQIAEINGWDEKAKIYHMQNRLKGLARKWYNGLTTYNYTWQEWKKLILTTFPDHYDFASMLKKLLARQKQSYESWDKYYFEKMELVRACEIGGKNAVSCIIDGITNSTIETGAKAGRYQTPEELYANYLTTLSVEERPFKTAKETHRTRTFRTHQPYQHPHREQHKARGGHYK